MTQSTDYAYAITLGTAPSTSPDPVSATTHETTNHLLYDGSSTAAGSPALWNANGVVQFATYTGYASGSDPIILANGTYYLLTNTLPGASVSTSQSSLCLLEGTRIETAEGPVAIEALKPGDRVRTVSGALRVVKFLGHEQVAHAAHLPADRQPVRIAAGAFACGIPSVDLWMSPEHAVFAEGLLIPVRCLVNGSTIAHAPRAAFTYWHVELDRHDVMLAEGLPVESLLVDAHSVFSFDNAAEADVSDVFAAPCRPVVTQGAAVDTIRARLAARAAAPV